MRSKPTKGAISAAALQMKVRLARHFLERWTSCDGKLLEVNPRTHSVLRRQGVVRGKGGSPTPGIKAVDFKHLLNSKELPDGPLVFTADKSSRRAFALEMLVFDSRPEVRRSVVEYLSKISDIHAMTAPRTREVIKAERQNLTARSFRKWSKAAAEISDAIEKDLFLDLVGLRQSLYANSPEIYTRYFNKVMRPSPSALERYQLGLLSAAGQRAKLEQDITDITRRATDVRDAVDIYYRNYGHVPLSGTISISGLYGSWRRDRPTAQTMYDELWKWADSLKGPLPRYHVCYLLVDFPELIPADQFPALWREIAQVVHSPKTSLNEYPYTFAWKCRCLLARHYCHHIETEFPGGSGEAFALAAWSLSEAFASIFDGQDALEEVASQAIEPAYEFSSKTWQIVNPPTVPHALRFGTLLTSSLWSTALLCHLGTNMRRLAPASINPEDQIRIEESLKAAVLGQFYRSPTGKPAYAFEEPIGATIDGWVSVDRQVAEIAGALRDAAIKVSDWNGEPSPLTAMVSGHKQERFLIAQLLRVAAFLGLAPTERLWEMLQDDKWRSEMLLGGSEGGFEAFVDALLQVQALGGDKWLVYLPHYFASACEKASADRERQKALFTCTMIASISGDTTSAIQRMLKGEHREMLREDMEEWRSQLEALQKRASPWVAAKSRTALSALRITR